MYKYLKALKVGFTLLQMDYYTNRNDKKAYRHAVDAFNLVEDNPALKDQVSQKVLMALPRIAEKNAFTGLQLINKLYVSNEQDRDFQKQMLEKSVDVLCAYDNGPDINLSSVVKRLHHDAADDATLQDKIVQKAIPLMAKRPDKDLGNFIFEHIGQNEDLKVQLVDNSLIALSNFNGPYFGTFSRHIHQWALGDQKQVDKVTYARLQNLAGKITLDHYYMRDEGRIVHGELSHIANSYHVSPDIFYNVGGIVQRPGDDAVMMYIADINPAMQSGGAPHKMSFAVQRAGAKPIYAVENEWNDYSSYSKEDLLNRYKDNSHFGYDVHYPVYNKHCEELVKNSNDLFASPDKMESFADIIMKRLKKSALDKGQS